MSTPPAFVAFSVISLALLLTVYHSPSLISKYTPYRIPTVSFPHYPWVKSTDRFVPYKYSMDILLHPEKYATNNCAKFPLLSDIHYGSPYWQSLKVGSGTVNIYGAYWDDRHHDVVRLLVVYDKTKWPRLFCHLWYESRGDPITVAILKPIYGWHRRWGGPYENYNEPYILTCPAPLDNGLGIPSAVSLVHEPCDKPVTALKVQNETPSNGTQRQEFAVCVKWLLFPEHDISAKLVEWLEFVKLFGAAKVFIHLLQAHPNVLTVLSEYSKDGFVDVTEYGLPPPKASNGKLQYRYLHDQIPIKEELLPYNDCLYRNLKNYRWLAAFDIDEMIVPMIDSNWSTLMHKTLQSAGEYDCYFAENIYFLNSLQLEMRERNEIPAFGHMLKQVWRTQNYSDFGNFVKSFHVTDRILAMHNHMPIKCLYGKKYTCNVHKMNRKFARLQHYRENCLGHLSKEQCNIASRDPVRDTTLWKWKDIILKRIKNNLVKFNLLIN